MTPDRDLKMCCMMLSQISPPKEQSETRPRRFIGYGDNFRWDWPHPASDIATSTQLPSYRLHQSDVATLSVKHFQLRCKPAFKTVCQVVWCLMLGMHMCSVKRHGYPEGGLRSEGAPAKSKE